MTKRELSNTLRNLKFMQRAAQGEEKAKKEEEVVIPNGPASSSTPRRYVVIMEGDPHPGAIKGRMSFQSFNPSVDKLNDETSNVRQPEGSATYSGNQSGVIPKRENDGSTLEEPESLKLGSDTNGELKRKLAEVVSEIRYPSKSPKNVQGDQASPSNHWRSSHKQPKHQNLDWNVLRPPKHQNKSG